MLMATLNGTLSAQWTTGMINEVDRVFERFQRQGSPGFALAIVEKGKIVYQKGYGYANLEHNIPIEPSTVFYIGSVSKQFVTACILLLQEAGKIGLNDDVRIYVPELPDYGPTLTIRHLIHHTSGIRDYLELWSLAGNDYLDHVPKQAVMELICRQKELNFEPGEKHLYSNSCYFLLGLIVERISGQSLREFAQERIFTPLRMTHTHFHDNTNDLVPLRASGYQQRTDGRFENLIQRFDLVGSGGMYSNVQDLFLWDQNFYKNVLGSGSQSLLDTMRSDGLLNNGESCGYAFAVVNGKYRGLKTVGHSGALGGYRSYYVQFPDQQTAIILLSNLASGNPSQKAEAVADIILAGYFKQTAPAQTPTKQNTTGTDPILPITERPITGEYYSEELEARYYISSPVEGTTMVRIGYRAPMLLYGKPGENRLYFQEGNLRLVKSADGATIQGFLLDSGRVKNLWFEKVNR